MRYLRGGIVNNIRQNNLILIQIKIHINYLKLRSVSYLSLEHGMKHLTYMSCKSVYYLLFSTFYFEISFIFVTSGKHISPRIYLMIMNETSFFKLLD